MYTEIHCGSISIAYYHDPNSEDKELALFLNGLAAAFYKLLALLAINSDI